MEEKDCVLLDESNLRVSDQANEPYSRGSDQINKLNSRSSYQNIKPNPKGSDQANHPNTRDSDQNNDPNTKGSDQINDSNTKGSDQINDPNTKGSDQINDSNTKGYDQINDPNSRSSDQTRESNLRDADETNELNSRSSDQINELNPRASDQTNELNLRSSDQINELNPRASDQTNGLNSRYSDQSDFDTSNSPPSIIEPTKLFNVFEKRENLVETSDVLVDVGEQFNQSTRNLTEAEALKIYREMSKNDIPNSPAGDQSENKCFGKKVGVVQNSEDKITEVSPKTIEKMQLDMVELYKKYDENVVSHTIETKKSKNDTAILKTDKNNPPDLEVIKNKVKTMQIGQNMGRINYLLQYSRTAALIGKEVNISKTSDVRATRKTKKSRLKKAGQLKKDSNTKKMNNQTDFSKLSCTAGSLATAIGTKVLLKMTPRLKRQSCKGCGGPLIPTVTAKCRVRRKKKKSFMVVTCLVCCTFKRYPTNPDYVLRLDFEREINSSSGEGTSC